MSTYRVYCPKCKKYSGKKMGEKGADEYLKKKRAGRIKGTCRSCGGKLSLRSNDFLSGIF